jgi:predicted RNA-binding Zn ribbon-like protein
VSHDADVSSSAAAGATQDAPRVFDLDAGTLCLDFINTLDNRANPPVRESIATYADLVAFCRQADALDDATAARLTAAAEQRPAATATALERARAVREALFRLFSAVTVAEEPAAADTAILNTAHAAASAHGRIALRDGQFVWTWDDDPTALERPLWPIVSEAVELLLEGDLGRVRQCAAQDCAWLFLDTSRNHSRRWCSMSSCGNRAKVGSFRERRKAV